jgi:ketosteroid isomerase-like protein
MSTKTDREQLAELVHRYADAVVHRNGEQWGSTWSENATWVLGPGREVTGRPAILELWYSAMARFDAVVQNVVNGEVSVDGDTATGRWYIMEHFRKSSGESGILLAFYDDTYVRGAGGWQFASRQLSAQYQGPPDLSATFLNSTAS